MNTSPRPNARGFFIAPRSIWRIIRRSETRRSNLLRRFDTISSNDRTHVVVTAEAVKAILKTPPRSVSGLSQIEVACSERSRSSNNGVAALRSEAEDPRPTPDLNGRPRPRWRGRMSPPRLGANGPSWALMGPGGLHQILGTAEVVDWLCFARARLGARMVLDAKTLPRDPCCEMRLHARFTVA